MNRNCIIILILKHDFEKINVLQFGLALLYGVFVDINLGIFSWIEPNFYIAKIGLCVLSCIVSGFGIWLEAKSDTLLLPQDGAAFAICDVINKKFSLTRQMIDFTLVVLGAIASF